MADCPKYKCDNDVLLDCEHCKFLKQLTKTIRRNAKYEDALSKHIEDALKEYSADNIDIAKDEMTGNISIIYPTTIHLPLYRTFANQMILTSISSRNSVKNTISDIAYKRKKTDLWLNFIKIYNIMKIQQKNMISQKTN
jgi:hypothetical protein